jgi:single-stranded-DNA-specific exonuclease
VLEKCGFARLLPSFLKVVAIATIADAVPLLGENRVFAKLGLEGLKQPVNAGLKALMEAAQVTSGRAPTTGEVGFRLAPRLNAAGRMDVARDVIDLFSTRDPAQAKTIAEHLNQLNQERQQAEKQIVEQAMARIAGEASIRDAWCMVVDGEGWHKGVIGIAATRLVERYCRPVLVVARDGAEAQGSARSIEKFNMLNALESCAHLFTRLGGHAHAAGFALPGERIPELRAALEKCARECLCPEDLEPKLRYDAELRLDEITAELWADLKRMEPFGAGNPEPVFVARRLCLLAPPRVVADKHLKLRLRQAATPVSNTPAQPSTPVLRTFDALGWWMADRIEAEPLLPQDALDLAFTIVENLHPEFGGLELSFRDFAKPGQ